LNRRYREILSIVLNTDGCITGNELAKLCAVGLRTIREDIKGINVLLKKYNIKINSVLKKGYCLEEKSKQILKKNNIIRKVLDYEYIVETPASPLDRQIYILLKLTTIEIISVEELADSLYVSLSTINNDIVGVKKWLKRNLKLVISYSLNNGIKLKANEMEKRNIISWILATRQNASTISKYWNYLFEDKEVNKNLSILYHIVRYETQKYNCDLSGHSSQLLCLEILVAVKRCQLGFNLNHTDNINETLMPLITDIKQKVEKELSVKLSETEWLNLQNYFKSKQFLFRSNISNFITDETIYVVDEFEKVLHYKFNIDLSANLIARDKLILYVGPMINRLKYRHCIPNKISEKAILNYQNEFKMATEIQHIIKGKLNLNIDVVELSYIAIHLVSMSGAVRHKLNTAVICDYDESIVSLIKDEIKNHFEEKIEICNCYTYQGFKFENEDNIKKIEFVVTTSTIADITNIPFIQINPVIEPKDIESISEYLDKHKIK